MLFRSTPNLSTSEAGTYSNAPAWLGDPFLAETAAAATIKKVSDVYTARAGAGSRTAAVSSFEKQLRSLARLNAAGVTIAPGQVGPVKVRVAIVNDTLLERSEQFQLTVSATGAGPGTGTATVLDDGTGLDRKSTRLNSSHT